MIDNTNVAITDLFIDYVIEVTNNGTDDAIDARVLISSINKTNAVNWVCDSIATFK